jgi:inner membrane protein
MNFIPFIWAFFGLIMVFSEFFIPGFVIFFFGAGAILTSILSFLFSGLKSRLLLQIAIWLASSGITLFFLRKYLARVFKGKLISKDLDTDYIGKKVKVIEKITPQSPGRIRLAGTTWHAKSYDETFEAGEYAEIIEKENMSFVVTRKIMEDE